MAQMDSDGQAAGHLQVHGGELGFQVGGVCQDPSWRVLSVRLHSRVQRVGLLLVVGRCSGNYIMNLSWGIHAVEYFCHQSTFETIYLIYKLFDLHCFWTGPKALSFDDERPERCDSGRSFIWKCARVGLKRRLRSMPGAISVVERLSSIRTPGKNLEPTSTRPTYRTCRGRLSGSLQWDGHGVTVLGGQTAKALQAGAPSASSAQSTNIYWSWMTQLASVRKAGRRMWSIQSWIPQVFPTSSHPILGIIFSDR